MDQNPWDVSLNRLQETLRAEIEGSAARTQQALRAEIQSSAGETRRYVNEKSEETRRHFEVVAEGLESKVEIVAEGVATVDDRLERLRGEVKQELQRVDRRLLRLEAQFARFHER